jgi:AcrR family transcriptional regulator
MFNFLLTTACPVLILKLNTFNMPPTRETGEKIFQAALELFRTQGFDNATMRDIAQSAGVATGAAYYYYPSKDAILLDFYRRVSEEMEPKIEEAVTGLGKFEDRLRNLIGIKLAQFTPNRGVLRALLRSGADPAHPLSPFSARTKEIRDGDIAWFRRILTDCDLRIPRDLAPVLPGILWFFQMGLIFFWVIDDSPEQRRTSELLQLAAKVVARLVKLSTLPFMRPVRKTALRIAKIVSEAV